MRLKKAQREALLTWLAEGIDSPEANHRAAQFEPAFSINRQMADYYRDKIRAKFEQLKQAGELDAMKSGLALKEERVKRLSKLAGLLEEDLFGSDLTWTDQVKMIGSGLVSERIEYQEFNSAEIVQYRGILEDIAKEVGDRTNKTDLTTNGKDLPTAIVNVYLPDNGRGSDASK